MTNPFRALVDNLGDAMKNQVGAVATVGTDAALAEVPLLADLLKGQQVELVITLQLKSKQ
jgi:hypothetical protein